MKIQRPILILASASPRRAELMQHLGIGFSVIKSSFTEEQNPGEKAYDYVKRNAIGKGRDVAKSLKEKGKNSLIVSADTIVVLGEQVLEKPKDEQDAARMIRLLSDKTHEVYTACAFTEVNEELEIQLDHSFTITTEVTFRRVWEYEIERYIKTPEPYDKSGSYGIAGSACVFMRDIKGSFTNVMGLPMAECSEYLLPKFHR